ncbi:MAG: tetratricopeptide repeat protein, partial [Magnetococcales bacterium]|nr:tetratricopeptide repeat protein [Magnetococcales bacterium]
MSASPPHDPPGVSTVREQVCALFAAGRVEEALAVADGYRTRAEPDAHLLNLIGACHLRLGQPEPTLACWQQALNLQPDLSEVACNLGVLLHAQHRFVQAEAVCRQGLGWHPDLALLWFHLGLALAGQQRSDEAEAALRQAIHLDPELAEAHFQLGNLCCAQQRHLQGEAAYRQVVRLQPGHADALNNLGVVLNRRHPSPEAEAAYTLALRHRPDFPDAQWNLSLLCLAQGRFQEGFRWYEARYHPGRSERKTVPIAAPFPMWRGEEVAGRALLIVAEQGYGDQIQFSRFVTLLKKRGAGHLTLLCTAPLAALLSSLEGLDRVLLEEETREYPEHHYWTFLMSIPHHLGITLESLPADLPCLRPPVSRLASWGSLHARRELGVGLVWKGDGTHRNDSHRSLPDLTPLAPLWEVPGVVFVGLQKGAGGNAAPDDSRPLLSLGDRLHDFAETAAVVEHLDLVISIDSAVAHLAGALNKPCWVLLPAVGCDWRWLTAGDSSPWYPGVMRLFRQREPGDWSGVVEEMRGALVHLAQEKNASFQRPLTLLGQDRPREALTLAEAWLDRYHPQPTLFNLAAVCHRRLGRPREAEWCWRQAVAIQPEYAEAWFNLGNLQADLRRPAAAGAAFRRVLALHPDHGRTWNNLGVVLKEQGDFPAAEAAYREAVACRPEFADAWNNLGNLLAKTGRRDEAEKAFRSVLELQPDHAGAHNGLGLLRFEQLRFHEARAAFREALRLAPDFIDACNNLAVLLSRTRRLDEAEQVYRRILQWQPRHAEAYTNLAIFL